MRTQGSIYRRPRSPFFWIRYSYQGTTYRESTKEKSRARAGEYLDRRLAEIGADVLGLRKFVGPASDRIQMGRMFAALRDDLRLRGLRSFAATDNHLSHAAAAFGDWSLKETTAERVDQWIAKQVAAGRIAPSTLNRRLQLLRQALTLAVDRGLLAQAPKIRKLSEKDRVRRGFFESDEIERVIHYLPEDLRDLTRFAWLTGWRKGAIISLRWADIDLTERTVRLRSENDKAGRGQVLPLEGALWLIIERRGRQRLVNGAMTAPVFHRKGKPIRNFYKAWTTATRMARCPDKLFHDTRRSAVRNMVQAGVPEQVAMQITGHRTRSTFDRYHISSLDDLRKAQNRLQSHLARQDSTPKVVSIDDAREGERR